MAPQESHQPMLEDQIKADIDRYITDRDPRYGNWYVGIAAAPRDRLFEDHKVDKNSDLWIYRKAMSSTAARSIEKYFTEQKGTQGGPGGGDDSTRFVYAYKIMPYTRP